MRDTVLFHNAILAALFVLGLPALIGAFGRHVERADGSRGVRARVRAAIAEGRLGLPFLAVLTVALFLVILLSMDRVWMYYFVPPFPFAAVIGGWLIARWWETGVGLVRGRGRPTRFGSSWAAVVSWAVLLIGLVVAWNLAPRLEHRLRYFKREMERPASERVHTYEWKPAPLPGFVNELVRAAIWRDERTIGYEYSSFEYLLWHESRQCDVVDEMVDAIRELSDEDDLIFGDSGSVPLLALLSGRDIAAAEVDTNIQRYRSGNADPAETVARIDEARTRLIVLRDRFGVAGLTDLKLLVKRKYRLARSFRSAQKRVFRIFVRRADADGSTGS
jgi:hypothetical protein